ncbi:MAG: hypothetical protein WBE26_11295 [Phycisphaerae bacterium]
MPRDKLNLEELLLDWHLDQPDEEDRSWIEEELRRDEQLRAKSDRLGQILQPLDHWTVAPGRPNLADKVLAYVEGSTRDKSPVLPFPTEEGGYRRSPFLSLRELVAVAACILLLIGVFVPGVSGIRSRSHRAICASNLGSIFRGVTAYQQAFAGSLPFAGSCANASWLPGGAPDQPYASNSRHTYLLVKLDYGPSAGNFICPACRSGKPMREDNRVAYNDFARACNVSYASLNLAGPSPNLRPRTRIAYISDANPLFVNARFNESIDPDKTNSPAHGGKGQTVLTLDGSVKWMTTPVYGPERDNLWLIGNIRRYTGVEIPAGDDDVQLLPGYPATDPVVCRTLQR